MTESDEFIANLKRFNVKERNFLMRYALSPTLSDSFASDLIEHLQKTGMLGLDGAKVEYFGMDYHLEWIHAALLLATKELRQVGNEPSDVLEDGQTGRIEDVDLLVVLRKLDCNLVMVLIEAKGVDSFNKKQFTSKANRLLSIKETPKGDLKPVGWLTPVMLLMSPKAPSEDTCKEFAKQLAPLADESGRVRFWQATGEDDKNLLWLRLKQFGEHPGQEPRFLKVGTCNKEGQTAKNIADRKAVPYTHWRVEMRNFSDN